MGSFFHRNGSVFHRTEAGDTYVDPAVARRLAKVFRGDQPAYFRAEADALADQIETALSAAQAVDHAA